KASRSPSRQRSTSAGSSSSFTKYGPALKKLVLPTRKVLLLIQTCARTIDDWSEWAVSENVVDRHDARFGDGIQDALRRATMPDVEPPDHHSSPNRPSLMLFL